MPQSDVPKAKVFVLKDPTIGNPEFEWKVGFVAGDDIFVVAHDAHSFEAAWAWLFVNYKRDTV